MERATEAEKSLIQEVARLGFESTAVCLQSMCSFQGSLGMLEMMAKQPKLLIPALPSTDPPDSGKGIPQGTPLQVAHSLWGSLLLALSSRLDIKLCCSHRGLQPPPSILLGTLRTRSDTWEPLSPQLSETAIQCLLLLPLILLQSGIHWSLHV